MAEEKTAITSLFINVGSKPFTGYWDGKARTFKPSEQMWMPDFLARHYAKHLTNQLLLEDGKETMTSPKRPEQVPAFMEIFNRAYRPGNAVPVSSVSELDAKIEAANLNKGESDGLPQTK